MRLAIFLISLTCFFAIFSARLPGQEPLTAKEIVQRYYKSNGMSDIEGSVDRFVVGDPDSRVSGLCITATATVDVIKAAAEKKLNFIIAHEPTFYSGRDNIEPLANDPVLVAKQNLLEHHNMIIWRNHDHIHRKHPDGIVEGMTKKLGWEKHQVDTQGDKNNIFNLSEQKVADLGKFLADRLDANRIRIVGDPNLVSGKIGLVVGAPASLTQMRVLQRKDVEILVAGETREWETVEYVRDASSLGMRKALILVGHMPSEEEGMKELYREMKELVTEIPVEFIAAGDPFWKHED